MNKLFALLLTVLFITGCEFYTYETPMRPAVIPNYSNNTHSPPECYNADYQYDVGHYVVCEWQCASYRGYNRTSLKIYFERRRPGHLWEVHESLGPHYCYY